MFRESRLLENNIIEMIRTALGFSTGFGECHVDMAIKLL